MVESTALEMRHTRKGIAGSNPALSAKLCQNNLSLQVFARLLQGYTHPSTHPRWRVYVAHRNRVLTVDALATGARNLSR